MTWESKTGQFGTAELKMLEEMPIEELIGAVLASQPLVALRVFAELVLQGARDKYMPLVYNPEFEHNIAAFNADPEVSQIDRIYAELFSFLLAGG